MKGKDKLEIRDAAAALNPLRTAYKAVMKPTEGTILTVARKMGEVQMPIIPYTDMNGLDVIRKATKTLQETPELLPVLKEASRRLRRTGSDVYRRKAL